LGRGVKTRQPHRADGIHKAGALFETLDAGIFLRRVLQKCLDGVGSARDWPAASAPRCLRRGGAAMLCRSAQILWRAVRSVDEGGRAGTKNMLPGTASETVPAPGATNIGFGGQSRYVDHAN